MYVMENFCFVRPNGTYSPCINVTLDFASLKQSQISFPMLRFFRDFMETLNTLKYANRARNIKNKVIKIINYYDYYCYAVFTGTLVFLLDCSVELISMV